ncbi:hypothetical protein NUU61_003524 [Penicillium alfredii]|uniref:Uncharacterized protein n=1 Tax=Penicillium alfredii TaxID=1506179 RepID=A0A9W9FJY4_9EURO|nr:uncharacterized protein NUU61_003524 [Penicillium alfredii]KAJ5101302.1 hypothetical protein NUU61_003524 [Penicillium alfredii]
MDLEKVEAAAAKITDVKHLASYNWIEAPTPTIVVPGCPPRWSPSDIPRQLQQDCGLFYIAENSARQPASPLESLFQALCLTDPSFDIRTVNIVTDRHILRQLLAFHIPNSIGHHIIVSYSFSGLKFLVQHETDGYVDTALGSSQKKPSKARLVVMRGYWKRLLPEDLYPKWSEGGNVEENKP